MYIFVICTSLRYLKCCIFLFKMSYNTYKETSKKSSHLNHEKKNVCTTYNMNSITLVDPKETRFNTLLRNRQTDFDFLHQKCPRH